jgi:uncharacterized protein YjdB
MSRTTLVLRVAAAALATVASIGCSGTPTLPSSTITTLSISGSPPAIGATSQYSATVVMATSNVTENVTALATWTSDNTGIATVSRTGIVTGIAAGSTNLTATYNGSTVTAQVTIP